jgi:hypothetical protein
VADPEPGAGATETHDGPEAALRREEGVEATGTRNVPGAALSQETNTGATRIHDGPGVVIHFIITWSLNLKLPDPQLTDIVPLASSLYLIHSVVWRR